jgi:hypothetical protein
MPMGFFSRLDQSGPFIKAWQARYGPLSRADLLIMRDENLGLFTAWTELEDKTPWTVDLFIASFSSWGRPNDIHFEYLLAYRLTVAGPTTKMGAVIEQWRLQVGAIADYYPPAAWANEWANAVQLGTRKRGTKDGRMAAPGQVILGGDAMALAEEQLARNEIGPD